MSCWHLSCIPFSPLLFVVCCCFWIIISQLHPHIHRYIDSALGLGLSFLLLLLLLLLLVTVGSNSCSFWLIFHKLRCTRMQKCRWNFPELGSSGKLVLVSFGPYLESTHYFFLMSCFPWTSIVLEYNSFWWNRIVIVWDKCPCIGHPLSVLFMSPPLSSLVLCDCRFLKFDPIGFILARVSIF